MNVKSRWTSKITSLFPYLLLLVAGLGLAVTLLLHRTDLAVFSLVLVIPLVLAAIILLIGKSKVSNRAALPLLIGKIRFSYLVLVNVFIFIINIISLISYETRPLIYFIVVSISSGIIFLQILCKRPGWADGLIIFEIILLSLNLIWGVTLKYPFYFGDTDVLGHIYYIDTILNTAHTESIGTSYVNFPLYHVLNAIGVEITGLSLRTTLFLIMGITWQIGTVFAYLVFKKLSNSKTFSLIACLLFALASNIIFYGSYSIARSLAFVFFMVLLYLIINRYRQQPIYVFLTVMVMSALIMTHHLTALFIIPILLFIYICQKSATRFSRESTVIPAFFVLLYSVCTIAYLVWVSHNMLETTLPGQIRALLETDVEVKSDPLEGYGLIVILGQIYYSFVLLLCLLGIRRILDCYRSNQLSKNAHVFSLVGVFMLVVYMPGPMELFQQSNIAFVRRFILIVTPFIICLAAFGIEYLISLKDTLRKTTAKFIYPAFIASVVIVPATFFSLIGTGLAQDCGYFPHTAETDTPYFTNSELASFSFIDEEADILLPLYSDFQTRRNILWLNSIDSLNVLEGADISYIQDGYALLRVGELRERGALSFFDDIRRYYRYRPDPSNPSTNILGSLSSEDLIYCSSAVQTYIVHNESASP